MADFSVWRACFLALAGGDPEALLVQVAATRNAPLLQYARALLTNVALEFRADVHEAFSLSRGGGNGASWQVSLLEKPNDAEDGRCVVSVRAPGGGEVTPRQEEAAPTGSGRGGLKPLLLMSLSQKLLLLVCRAEGADTYACVALDLESVLGDTRTGPRMTTPPASLKCMLLASCEPALARALAICQVHTLRPSLRAAIVPGDDGGSTTSMDAASSWASLGSGLLRASSAVSSSRLLARLNAGQRAAIEGVDGAVSLINGPAASGKATVAAYAALLRLPPSERLLVCCSSARGAEALLAELEHAAVAAAAAVAGTAAAGTAVAGAAVPGAADAGLTVAARFAPLLVAGPSLLSARGDCSRRYSTGGRLEHDSTLMMAEAEVAAWQEEAQTAAAALEALQGSSKKGKGGKGDEKSPDKDKSSKSGDKGDEEALFVSRQAEKLQSLSKLEQSKPARKTPGVTRLIAILTPDFLPKKGANQEHLVPPPSVLIEAAHRYQLRIEWNQGGAEAEKQTTAANKAAAKKRAAKAHEALAQAEADAVAKREAAAARLWCEARIVVCAVEDCATVAERMAAWQAAATAAEAAALAAGEQAAAPAAAALPAACPGSGGGPFGFVLVDGAGSVLEVDALRCVLSSGAASVLLVGDPQQVPPSSTWAGADGAGYTNSLLARLHTARAKLGDYGGSSCVLSEQYRMPPPLCAILSTAFYKGKLRTAPTVESARHHPLPLALVDVGGSEARVGGSGGGGGGGAMGGGGGVSVASFTNEEEANAAVRLVTFYCSGERRLAPSQLLVVSFYASQCHLIQAKLREAPNAAMLKHVAVATPASVGRCAAQVVLVSCVRAGASGAAAAAGAGGGLGPLADGRLVCVALSRACEALVVLGSTRCLSIDRTWRAVTPGLSSFASAAAYEAAAVQAGRGLATWAEPLRAEDARSLTDAAERKDATERRAESLRREAMAEARWRVREAAGIAQPKRLEGWGKKITDVVAKAEAAGGEATARGEAAKETAAPGPELSPQQTLDQQVLAAVAAALGDDASPLTSPGSSRSNEVAAAIKELAAARDVASNAGALKKTLAAMAAAVDLAPTDCFKPCLMALLAPVARLEEGGKKARAAMSKKRLGLGAPLLRGLGSGAVAHLALLAALQASCEAEPRLTELFEHLLVKLYEEDVLPEAVVLAWADGAKRAPEGSALRRLHIQATNFLTWLAEADEDDEDDEE